MPELPDIECLRQYLHDTSLHRNIAFLQVFDPSLVKELPVQEFEQYLKGRNMTDTARYGKYLFVNLDGQQWIVMHFGMTGGLQYFQEPDTKPQHANILFSFSNGHHLAYINRRNLGSVYLISSPIEFIHTHSLGIDALDSRMDFALFQRILKRKRGMIKSILMDQHVIAGLGNVYTDEILFQSGVNPASTLSSLPEEKFRDVFTALKDVLSTAIQCGADPNLMPGDYIIRTRKSGSVCPRCTRALKHRRISGRSAFFCPRCQPES